MCTATLKIQMPKTGHKPSSRKYEHVRICNEPIRTDCSTVISSLQILLFTVDQTLSFSSMEHYKRKGQNYIGVEVCKKDYQQVHKIQTCSCITSSKIPIVRCSPLATINPWISYEE
jgi:hypothetical protein